MGLWLATIGFLIAATWAPPQVVCAAEPRDPENYVMFEQYPLELAPGALMEGSADHGGITPDYHLDMDAPEFQPLLKMARELRDAPIETWQKVNRLAQYIRKELLKNGDPFSPPYQATQHFHRMIRTPVALSRFVCIQSGVCRENALILHFALKEAGIPNRFVYTKAQSKLGNHNTIQPHAFTVVRLAGEDWAADSYNPWFHGYRLKDLLSPEGVGPDSISQPGTPRSEWRRRVLEIRNYPRVWIPKGAAACSQGFSELK